MTETSAGKTRSRKKLSVPMTPEALAPHLPADTPHHVSPRFLTVHADNYAWLPDGSVDLVLTDPPFNIAQDTNFHTYENNTINSYRFDKDKGWDTYTQEGFIQMMREWAEEFARVLRPGGSFAVFCADSYLSHFRDALEAAGLNVRRTLTWRKPNAVPINRKTMMMSACEYVIIGVKGSKATFNVDLPLTDTVAIRDVERVLVADKVASIVEKYVRDSIDALETGNEPGEDTHVEAVQAAVRKALAESETEVVKRVTAMYVEETEEQGEYLRGCVPNYVSFNSKGGNRLHPTEKPVPLLRYLCALMSNPGDLVLDPFGGSGSTGEAVVSLGREAVIVERDEEYFTALSLRLQQLP